MLHKREVEGTMRVPQASTGFYRSAVHRRRAPSSAPVAMNIVKEAASAVKDAATATASAVKQKLTENRGRDDGVSFPRTVPPPSCPICSNIPNPAVAAAAVEKVEYYLAFQNPIPETGPKSLSKGKFHRDEEVIVKTLIEFGGRYDPMWCEGRPLPCGRAFVPPDRVKASMEALRSKGYLCHPPEEYQ